MAFVFFVFVMMGVALAFHQDEYYVINERCDLLSYNHSYSKNVSFALSLINRTTRAFNFRAHLLKQIDNCRVVAQFYKFASNEYRLFPITVPINLCKELKEGSFGFDDIKNYSNIARCPFKRGWYYIENYIPDYTKYPPHVPIGKYKAEMKFYENDNFVMELHWYGRYERIIKWD